MNARRGPKPAPLSHVTNSPSIAPPPGVSSGLLPKARQKRGQAPFVRSTRRAVPAKGACPLFRVDALRLAGAGQFAAAEGSDRD